MVQGILKVLLLFLGKGLVRLGYGAKGSEARKLLGMKSTGLSILFSLLASFWLIFGVLFYSLFKNTADAIYSLITIIACPVIYILWVLYARSTVPALLQKAEPMFNQKAEDERVKAEQEKAKAEKAQKESLLKKSGF